MVLDIKERGQTSCRLLTNGQSDGATCEWMRQVFHPVSDHPHSATRHHVFSRSIACYLPTTPWQPKKYKVLASLLGVWPKHLSTFSAKVRSFVPFPLHSPGKIPMALGNVVNDEQCKGILEWLECESLILQPPLAADG